jgi:hypothetical protein
MGDERDDRPSPGSEGFTESILRDATTTGARDDKPPPEQPQSAAFPRRGADDADDEPGANG